MKAVKILGKIVLGLVGLVAALYLIGLAINWNDRPPSPDAVAFQQLIDERPSVPDAQNAYVYVLGFAAPKGQDPIAVGVRRKAWIAAYSWANRASPDPGSDAVEMRSRASTTIANFDEQCRADDRRPCADAFRQLGGEWQPDEIEALTLQRYRALLGLRAWHEDVPLNPAAPIPSYAEVSYAQRLHLVTLLQLAKQGDAPAVRDGLNMDSLYWRSAADQSQTLIGRMIAVAGLRNHYFFGNLVLEALPVDKRAAAVPPDWERAYSAEERSMRLVMAGELVFVKATLLDAIDEGQWYRYEIEPTWLEVASFKLSSPFLKVQDSLNRTAASYAELCRQFEVPMAKYRAAEQALQAARGNDAWFSIYNPVGTFLQKLTAQDSYISYTFRAASPEGMRRGALLAAQLRIRGVPAAQAAAEVASASLRDPYTNAAFEWDAKRQSLIFDGPEDHKWRRQEYFY